MTTSTTLSSREFNQDTARAKRAAESGPVFITDRGTPAHVLLTMGDYEALLGAQPSIVDWLAMPVASGEPCLEFETTRSRALHRPADLDENAAGAGGASSKADAAAAPGPSAP